MPSNRSEVEQIPENRQLLNQQAKRLLAQTGDPAPGDALYLLDLLNWALMDSQDVEVRPELRGEMEDAVGWLFLQPPKKAWAWLVFPDGPGQDPRLTPAELRDLSLNEVAAVALDFLHSRLGESWEGYPPQSARAAV